MNISLPDEDLLMLAKVKLAAHYLSDAEFTLDRMHVSTSPKDALRISDLLSKKSRAAIREAFPIMARKSVSDPHGTTEVPCWLLFQLATESGHPALVATAMRAESWEDVFEVASELVQEIHANHIEARK